MKLTKKFKKGMAIVLSTVLTAGLIQIIPQTMTDVKAADSSILPTVTAYATKDALMDDTFAPGSSKKGKLTFGKNSAGNTQEWYVFGKCSVTGTSDDNTVIFATKPITKSRFADASYSGTSYYDYSGGEEYRIDQKYIKNYVYCNYYSTSTVRKELKLIEKNTNYFSTAEQALMNEPEVSTYDNGSGCDFWQKDKLYLASGWYGTDSSGNTTYQDVVCVSPAHARMQVKISDYIESNELFWLRTPCNMWFGDETWSQALAVTAGNKSGAIIATAVNAGVYGVQPAAVLNLTDVLFASAAKTDKTTGIIDAGSAMTLRLDGSSREIGEATYDTDTGVISAAKSSAATGDVSLVVQGNDGIHDWYYSQKLTGSAPVTVKSSDIETAVSGLASDVDLSKCQIWLETTDADDNMIYAKNASEIKTLNEVEIKFSVPKAGEPITNEVLSHTEGTRASIKWMWNKDGDDIEEGTIAGYAETHYVEVKIEPETGYKLADKVAFIKPGSTSPNFQVGEDGTITYLMWWTTDFDTIVSITTPDAITVANGTAYENMNLPERVNITTKAGTVTSAAVTWNTDKPISGTYDPAVMTEQVVKLRGTISFDNLHTSVGYNTEITVIISAAGITGAPTASVPSGTYTEDQLVTLSSTTEGAKIYYTLADRKLTVENGTEYTGPIEVTGVAGEHTITQIKAMAVKDGMQASEVVTFTYMINKPVPVIEYTIKATAGPNGSITPSGDVKVVQGCDQAFNIKPDEGYEVESVIVDGIDEGRYEMYSFDTVKASHTIEATFKKIASVVEAPTIISQPLNNITVRAGETATFVVSATGMDLTYQWKIDRNDGKGFVDIAGANNAFYTTGAADKTCNGFKYQCVISNPGGSVTSDTATLTVLDDTTPTATPTVNPTATPTVNPTATPTVKPTATPTVEPTATPTVNPTATPTVNPTTTPTVNPTATPTVNPTATPTVNPTTTPTVNPTPTPVPSSKADDYRIIKGANSTWASNADGSLAIQGNGDPSKFQSVKVDGKVIDASNYTIAEDSTILLKADFLKTLSAGSHSFELIWTDGSADTTFTVAKNTSDDNNNSSDDKNADKNNSNDKNTNNNNNNDKNTNNSNTDKNTNNNSNDTNNNSTQPQNNNNKDNQDISAPRLGDTSNVALWVTLAAALFAGLSGMLVRSKKKDCK